MSVLIITVVTSPLINSMCAAAGNEGIPAWDDRLKKLQHTFVDAYVHASPDFQTELGYGVSRPGQANLTLCSKQARASK